MIVAALVLSIVAQDFLKQLVQLAEVVVGGSPLNRSQKWLAPLGRERRCIPGEECRITAHVADVVAISLLRRAVAGAVGQWLRDFETVGHKA